MKIVRYGILLVTLSCGVELQVPSNTTIACKSDADCLNGLVCDGVCVVSLDTDPPGLVNVDTPDSHTVRFIFDEPILEASVATMALTFAPQLEIYGTAFSGDEPTVIAVATPELVPGTTYAITVGNLSDRSGNVLSPNPSETTITIAEIPTDTRAPDLLSPEDGAVTSLEASLVWSGRTGATSYTVEVAHDAGFNNLFGTYEVQAPDTAKTVTLDDARSFYWRVRSNLSGVSNKQRFDALGSTVYVYCPAGDTCAEKDSGGALRRQTGSKDTPYFLPSRGVYVAQALNASEVRIAARGGGAAYNDSLSITAAINITGGYDSSFADASYNPTTHPTVVSALYNTMLLNGVVGPMLLKGLELTTTQNDGNVLKITGCENVTVDRVFAHGSSTLEVADTATNPTVITNSRFESTAAGPLVAFLFGTIIRNSILSSPSSSALGLYVDNGTIIERSTIAYGKAATSTGYPVGILLKNGSILRNNILVSDMPVGALVGAQGIVTVVGNTLVGRVAEPARLGGGNNKNYSSLIAISEVPKNGPLDASGAIITNNLIVATSTNARCFSEGVQADPGSFQNNVLVGCTTNAYAEFFTYNSSADPIKFDLTKADGKPNDDTINNLNGTQINSGCYCTTSRYSGNIISTLAPSDVFVDYDGPDNQLYTVDDNDMRLLLTGDTDNIKGAGKNGTATDCGRTNTSTPCGGDGLDFAGTTRTIPWSVGAYEKD